MRTLPVLAIAMAFLVSPHSHLTPAMAQTTIPATTTAADAVTLDDLAKLRAALKDAYNKGDVDRMLQYLHPEIVIIFPDGEILQGRDALRGYYDRMMKGPNAVVARHDSSPEVIGRATRGDVNLAWGKMNDHYVLKAGEEFALDSRFTATVLRSPDGPPETGGWRIRSFHSSTDAFDNAVLKTVAKRSSLYAGGAGVVVGLLLGLASGWLIRRGKTT